MNLTRSSLLRMNWTLYYRVMDTIQQHPEPTDEANALISTAYHTWLAFHRRFRHILGSE